MLEGGHNREVQSVVFGTTSLDSNLSAIIKQSDRSDFNYLSLSMCVEWGHMNTHINTNVLRITYKLSKIMPDLYMYPHIYIYLIMK